jgi:hypothetical protein
MDHINSNKGPNPPSLLSRPTRPEHPAPACPEQTRGATTDTEYDLGHIGLPSCVPEATQNSPITESSRFQITDLPQLKGVRELFRLPHNGSISVVRVPRSAEALSSMTGLRLGDDAKGFLKELHDGDSVLLQVRRSESKKNASHVRGVLVAVLHVTLEGDTTNPPPQVIMEVGKVNQSHYPVVTYAQPQHPAEKVKVGESLEQGVMRGLYEELGIDVNVVRPSRLHIDHANLDITKAPQKKFNMPTVMAQVHAHIVFPAGTEFTQIEKSQQKRALSAFKLFPGVSHG